jgi:hypothetical protein
MLEVLAACAALAFFADNKRKENEIARQRFQQEKAMNDATLAGIKDELGLKREALEIERERNQLNQTTLGALGNISEQLAVKIASDLRQHCDWAVTAITQAGLNPHGGSIIMQRSGHYQAEKIFLAREFGPLLFERCKILVEAGWRVHLFVDSGSTLIPFIDDLARRSVRAKEEPWLKEKRLELYTNNLAGALAHMEHGREIYEDPYSDLVIPMRVLAGTPLATFAAVAGPQTVKMIMEMGQGNSKDSNVKVIGVITGNWIRIRRTFPRIPVPLARGLEHKEIKQAVVDTADEIYVLAPLGKLCIDITEEEINNLLEFSSGSLDRSRQRYGDLKIDVGLSKPTKAPRVKLITTSRRSDGFVLYRLSEKLIDYLGESDREDDVHHNKVVKTMAPSEFAQSNIEDLPHLAWSFSNLDPLWELQLEQELPHSHTRTQRVRSKLFLIDR